VKWKRKAIPSHFDLLYSPATATTLGVAAMFGMIVVSLAFVLIGFLGLIIAASGGSAQFMGIGLIVSSWLFLIGYHGRRAEQVAKSGDGH
tara:strand:+ start:1239 stop:1508 length:270 start_codon:yes stop_codon:yes gene_type:complete